MVPRVPALVRVHREELDVSGPITNVPSSYVSRGKLILVNDDDLTVAAGRAVATDRARPHADIAGAAARCGRPPGK